MIKSWTKGRPEEEERESIGIRVSVPLARLPSPSHRHQVHTPRHSRKKGKATGSEAGERQDSELLRVGIRSGPSPIAVPVNSCQSIPLLGLRINVDLPHKRFTDGIKAL